MSVCIFGVNCLCFEISQFVDELLAREPQRFGQKSVGEDVFPCGFCKMPCRLVCALLQCKLLDDVTVFESHAIMQGNVE